MIGKITSYFGTTCYPLILILFLLYLILSRKNERSKQILFSIIVFCFLFPFLYILCNFIGQEAETYRFLWLFPLSCIFAFLSVSICRKTAFDKTVVAMVVCIMILLSGSVLLAPSSIKMPENVYELDDEVIEIAEMINSECEEDVRLIAPSQVMIQIRQYSGNLCWAYTGRGQMMIADDDGVIDSMKEDPQYRLALAVQQGIYLDETVLQGDLESMLVDYVVLTNNSDFANHLSNDILKLIGNTENYSIYKVHEGKKE